MTRSRTRRRSRRAWGLATRALQWQRRPVGDSLIERRGRRARSGDEGQRARAFLAEVHATCRVGEEAAVLTSGTELRTYVAVGAVRRRAEGEAGLEGDGRARTTTGTNLGAHVLENREGGTGVRGRAWRPRRATTKGVRTECKAN
jgi:hypothetical protein